ncbi:MAG: tRNA dihydrouridine synthase DusB [Endomicrobium sp.]|jgi:tRNA-dihydrouridine synthase B|nr:tRNA dihydrouridine synthase DusB [Endomicrobium sp.]
MELINKQKTLYIGCTKLSNNIILAPMSGITDAPLRYLAKRNGAGLVYTEMISAKAIIHRNEKTKKIIKIYLQEKPIAVQIFGCDVYSMSEAAKIIADTGADIIDINLGCPAKKITKIGAGARLLDNKKLIFKILESVVKSVNIPITIKIRTGLIPNKNLAPQVIDIAQNCGIKMVVVHARPASQGNKGIPDLKSFADACKNAQIPIIANGGITNEQTAYDFLKIPNCSGIMIGQGAIANYSIFKRLENFFYMKKESTLPLKTERIQWFKEHIQRSIAHYGEKQGLIKIRKIACYYLKGLPNASKAQTIFNKTVTLIDAMELINNII